MDGLGRGERVPGDNTLGPDAVVSPGAKVSRELGMCRAA